MIAAVNGDGTYDIHYDDGDEEEGVEAALIQSLPQEGGQEGEEEAGVAVESGSSSNSGSGSTGVAGVAPAEAEAEAVAAEEAAPTSRPSTTSAASLESFVEVLSLIN